MKKFTLNVPKAWNYTPTDLMLEYARKHKSVEFLRIGNIAHLFIDGVCYKYDHWQILTIGERCEAVTVYLKEWVK